MAGDWIPWCKGLSRKREVMAIAKATGRSRREVACILMEFWEWADNESADGSLAGVSADALPALIPDTDPAFWAAVQASGWLAATDAGLVIPNFQRWMGQSAKKRLKKTVYQANWRAPGSSDVDADVDADVDIKISTTPSTTEPNRTNDGGDDGARAEIVAELVRRGLSRQQALDCLIDSPDPRLTREILAYHAANIADFHKPAAALKSMFKDPGRWGFEQTANGWQRPPSPPPANGRPAETTEQRIARVAAERAADAQQTPAKRPRVRKEPQ